MALLFDTGVLYAAADLDDAWHGRAAALLSAERGLRLVPVTVLPEVCYLLHDRLGARAERTFLAELGRGLTVEPLAAGDLDAARRLLDDSPEIGFVDASVVAIALRLHIRRLATTDRRHFGSVRLPRGFALELLP